MLDEDCRLRYDTVQCWITVSYITTSHLVAVFGKIERVVFPSFEFFEPHREQVIIEIQAFIKCIFPIANGRNEPRAV